MQHATLAQGGGKESEFKALLATVESAAEPEAACQQLQELVASVRPDSGVLAEAGASQAPLLLHEANEAPPRTLGCQYA